MRKMSQPKAFQFRGTKNAKNDLRGTWLLPGRNSGTAQCFKRDRSIGIDADFGGNLHRVPRLRFGIGVHEDCTLEQIARQQGVTRERIRQIEAQALDALRKLDAAWVLRAQM